MSSNNSEKIKAIIGLGNPGPKFVYTRHNIGFRVLDALNDRYFGTWQNVQNMEISEININGNSVLLIKPQTFMNNSGQIIPYLKKKNIEAKNILVVHDELELPFGAVKTKMGGSAKGHNGLKSIISFCGQDFYRLRFGIGRPENREEVPDYVLNKFDKNEESKINELIINATVEIEKLL